MKPDASRGTILRWEQEKADGNTYSTLSEQERRVHWRTLWLLELETDAADMIAAGNDGWPENFMPPSIGPDTAVVKSLLGFDGWTPLKGKLRTIQELKK